MTRIWNTLVAIFLASSTIEASESAASVIASDYRVPVSRVQTVIDLAQDRGVPARVIVAVVAVESSFNPDSVSSVGAVGYMQVRPEFWNHLGDLSDPVDNIKAGIYILEHYKALCGGLYCAIRAYYIGIDAELRGVAQVAGNGYIERVQAWLDEYNHLVME